MNDKQPKLIVMSGVPGSGKTTVSEGYVNSGVADLVLSRDDIRTELFGFKYHSSQPDKDCEKLVTETLHSRLSDACSKGLNVIYDATNIGKGVDNRVIKIAKSYGYSVERVLVKVSLGTALARNRMRGASGGRRVPDSVIQTMYERLNNSGVKFNLVVEND